MTVMETSSDCGGRARLQLTVANRALVTSTGRLMHAQVLRQLNLLERKVWAKTAREAGLEREAGMEPLGRAVGVNTLICHAAGHEVCWLPMHGHIGVRSRERRSFWNKKAHLIRDLISNQRRIDRIGHEWCQPGGHCACC
jgi:hypothetical protein